MKEKISDYIKVIEVDTISTLTPHELITLIQDKIEEVITKYPESKSEGLYNYYDDDILYIAFVRYLTDSEKEAREKYKEHNHQQFLRSIRSACRQYPEEMRKILSEEL